MCLYTTRDISIRESCTSNSQRMKKITYTSVFIQSCNWRADSNTAAAQESLEFHAVLLHVHAKRTRRKNNAATPGGAQCFLVSRKLQALSPKNPSGGFARAARSECVYVQTTQQHTPTIPMEHLYKQRKNTFSVVQCSILAQKRPQQKVRWKYLCGKFNL